MKRQKPGIHLHPSLLAAVEQQVMARLRASDHAALVVFFRAAVQCPQLERLRSQLASTVASQLGNFKSKELRSLAFTRSVKLGIVHQDTDPNLEDLMRWCLEMAQSNQQQPMQNMQPLQAMQPMPSQQQEQEELAKKAAINACAQASLEMRLQGQLQQELLWLPLAFLVFFSFHSPPALQMECPKPYYSDCSKEKKILTTKSYEIP